MFNILCYILVEIIAAVVVVIVDVVVVLVVVSIKSNFMIVEKFSTSKYYLLIRVAKSFCFGQTNKIVQQTMCTTLEILLDVQ